MSYAETLRASRDKAQVAFQEFALSTREYPAFLFCFFEGKDNPYYVPRIKRFTQKYLPIKCGNRDSVLKVHELIINRSEYKKYKKSFFTDRDFNSSTENPLIFETPCYSVENLYVSVNVFREILINEFHLSSYADKTVIKNCLFLYAKRQEEFHEAVRLFNAWYSCLIDVRNKIGINTGVNLENKLPKQYVDITLQSVTSNYNFETIKQDFPDATEIDDNTLNSKILEFKNCDNSKIFRGKYEMQFLIKFIQLLLQDANTNRTIIGSKISYAFGDNLSNQQAINIFEGYAETPETLNEYLQLVTQ